ncbi:MAG: dockerin type I domain-containing protein, partial [Tepidisphaeraceae bacterium]
MTSSSLAQTFTSDASLPGTAFSPGVRGLAIPAVTINRGEYVTGIPKTLEVSRGSSLRGVAGGLEADTFNWKNNNNSYRAGTLDYLRHSRDHNADLYITANIRGLVEPDPTTPGNQRFYDTTIPTLATLAADWVRYTNHIVPTYRQGQPITDPRDQAILNALVWNKSTTPGDSFDKLLPAGEAAVPKVKYWEIGNEPRVGLLSTYKVTNSYTFFAPPRLPDATHKTDFVERYKALSAAMLAEDPTIEVGPALQFVSSITEQEIVDSLLRLQPDSTYLPVDFLGYHPYQKLNEQTTPAAQETFLRGVYNDHLAKANSIRDRIAATGRDRYSVKLVASEHTVSNHISNDQLLESTMAHALGNTETVFSFARLGVQDAHYWVFPAHRWDGTEYPVFHAYEKLRDHMGDTLLSASAENTDNLHLYTTRDSADGEIALWGLNFSDATNITRSTPITNIGGRGKITLHTLGALSGATSLASNNPSSEMPGYPAHNVDWTSVDMTGTRLDNLSLTFGSAEITLLTIEKWRQISLPGDVNADGSVNALDSAIVTANNNQNEKNWWQGDLTGDGLVNSADAAVVTANNGVALTKQWNQQAGLWTTSGNWSPSGVPNSTGANAYLAGIIDAPRSITASTTIRLGTLAFNNANPYDIVGSGNLRMEATGSNSARVYVVQGDQKISVPLNVISNTIADIAADASLRLGSFNISDARSFTRTGNGTLTITGPQSHGPGAVLTVSGGTVNLDSNVGSATSANLTINANAITNFGSTQNLAALNVGAGATARINTGSGAVIKTSALSVAGTGKLDLADVAMIVRTGGVGSWNGSSYTGLTGLIRSGRNGGAWSGPGIITSMPEALTGLTTLAIATAGETGRAGGTFRGQSVSSADALVMYTWGGDANLDGKIGIDDYGQIDFNVGSSGSV